MNPIAAFAVVINEPWQIGASSRSGATSQFAEKAPPFTQI
jgi:hypothetical protein